MLNGTKIIRWLSPHRVIRGTQVHWTRELDTVSYYNLQEFLLILELIQYYYVLRPSHHNLFHANITNAIDHNILTVKMNVHHPVVLQTQWRLMTARGKHVPFYSIHNFITIHSRTHAPNSARWLREYSDMMLYRQEVCQTPRPVGILAACLVCLTGVSHPARSAPEL